MLFFHRIEHKKCSILPLIWLVPSFLFLSIKKPQIASIWGEMGKYVYKRNILYI